MTATARAELPDAVRDDVETLWAYHDMHHEPGPADVAIGLGSHDLGVATRAANLYQAGLVPRLVFTGANAPTTVAVFPRGEAVHYREHALALGVPDRAVLVEPTARNTGENITRSRDLLAAKAVDVGSVVLVSRPYQQRRAYATCRKLWPTIEVTCTSLPLALDDYVTAIGDPDRVINMLVGDTQRIDVYAERGYAIPQPMPGQVRDAYHRLTRAGYTARLV